MNESGIKQPHDEVEGQDEKTSEEESGGAGSVSGKRRHVRSQRMQAYLQQQDEAVPQKQRKCTYPGCEKLFSSAPGLRYHLRTHLPDASHFRCQHCKKEFKSHNGLKYHLQKTKCQDTPADAPSSQPPPAHQLSPPPAAHHLSPPLALPSAECEDRSSHTSARALPAKNDETDSMCDLPGEMASQDWPEPRHRKMESRRKKMEQAARRTAAEAEQPVASVPFVCRPLPLEHSGSSEAGPLLEFAKIATGPQSPLLRTRSMDWEQARLQRESDSARDVLSPRTVWQCFMPGTRVSLGAEDSSSPLWYPVETVAVFPLQQHGPVLPEDLSQPVPMCVISRQKSAEHDEEVELAFECESSHQSRLTASCVSYHPFFVRSKGWASCESVKTKEIYGLSSSALEVGDICLPTSCTRQTSSAKDSEGTEVNSLEYSSVVALSEMAQKRSQEAAGGQQQTTPVSRSDQHAPKAKRPMNAFLLWSQTKRPEFIMKFPRTNNRDISSMLSKEWRRLSESEKKQLQNEAKLKAERQKQQFPDCWKRKHHH